MLRRSTIIFLEFLAALIAGAAILLGVLFWRISGEEPLRVAFLTPYLEQALTSADGEFHVEIDDTVLTWAGWERTLDLRARGVRAIGENGVPIASVPQLSLTLSLRALLRGIVAPTSIEVFGPHLYLRRDSQGRFAVAGIRAPETDGAVQGDGSVFAAIMSELQDEPEPGSPTGFLRRMSIVGGRLTLDDQRLGLTWEAPEANISIRRSPTGLAGELALAVDQLGHPARFAANFDFDRASATIGIGGSFAGVDVPALGLVEPAFLILEGADLRLQGNFTTRIGLDGRIATTRFDLSSGPGQIGMPEQFDEPVPVQRVSLRGHVLAGGDKLVIETAVVDLGGPQLAASLSVSGLASSRTPRSGMLRVEGHVSAGNVPAADLARYWPKGAARGARNWVVENITDGITETAEADFVLRFPGGAGEPLVDHFEGSFDASGATVHYKKPLPPIVEAAGHATFTEREFAIAFTDGHLGNLVVESGRTVVTGLDVKDQVIDIEGVATGPFQEVLALLDHEPLGYAAKLGLDPADTRGTVRADISFRIPAKKDVDFDQIAMSVKGEVVDVGLAGALFDRDVTSPHLAVELDNSGMNVSGEVALSGLPARLQWRENFEAGEFRSRFVLEGRATAEQRATLGLDLRPHLDGVVTGEVVYTVHDETRSTVAADLDLGEAVLDIPELVWRKGAGTAGRAQLVADLSNGQIVRISSLSVTAGDLIANGRAGFSAGDVASLELSRLDFGKTRLSGVAVTFTPTRPEITIEGGQIDAEPWLAQEDEPATSSPAAEPAAEETENPILLSAGRLDRVIFGEGREVTNVSVLLDNDGAYWQRVILTGSLASGAAVTFRYQPDPATGMMRLSAAADDAGEALRTFGVYDNVRGGRLTVEGAASMNDPQRSMKMQAEVSQFRVVNAPVLARLLTIATLTGFVDVLTGEGLLFNRFTGEFVKTNGLVEVPLVRAHGPSVGLTATGKMDFDANTVDLEGTIAPAYIVNSILGNIPLIGDFLQGGKGEGIFAATYSARGSLDEPDISVNPLSALAPGFLRGMFDIFEGNGQPTTPRALPEPGKD